MFRSTASIVTVFVCFSAVAASLSAQAPNGLPDPVPAGFNITSLSINGSGCPPGTANYTLSGDGSAINMTFSKYFAQAGPGIPISMNRRNCQLTLGVSIPPGFSFGISSIDYHGYNQLDNEVTVDQGAIYYFQGERKQGTARSTLTGPIIGTNYTRSDSFDLVSTVSSPCGGDVVLNIGTDVRTNNANNRAGRGYISTDSIFDIAFQWQKC
jgi:hypothetical protein